MYCNLAQRILHLSCRIDITTDITDYSYRRWPGISSHNKTLKLNALTRKGYNGMTLHVMEQPPRFFALAYRASDACIYQ